MDNQETVKQEQELIQKVAVIKTTLDTAQQQLAEVQHRLKQPGETAFQIRTRVFIYEMWPYFVIGEPLRALGKEKMLTCKWGIIVHSCGGLLDRLATFRNAVLDEAAGSVTGLPIPSRGWAKAKIRSLKENK